ncbi:MAG: hypothetical protein PHS33_09190, partial [Candidatus Omnitrophica bacterium]|nr:hypothetical protein [Candidatus Omnitrophota bacterium]
MSDYIFEIDWDNNGDFFGVNEDCTADLVSVECRRGRDYASQLTGKVSPGRLAATMNNPAGKYSSFNAASPLYGNILPGRKIRLRGINPTLGQAVMVEEGTTNQLPLSEDWTSYTSKTAGTAITGDDVAYAPYSALADKIVMDAANNYIYKSKTGLSAITGQTWTFSAKVYVPTPSSVFISLTDGLVWAEGWIEKINLVAGWNNVKTTITFGATVSTTIVCVFSNYDMSSGGAAGGSGKGAASSGAITFWVLYSQLEQKAYPTSWIDSGVTRAAETLTIPTAGIFTKGNWTVEFIFNPTSIITTSGRDLWVMIIDANNYYALYVSSGSTELCGAILSGGIGYATSSFSMTQGTNYTIAFSGDGSVIRLYCNGIQMGSDVAYIEPVGALPANMYIGSNAPAGFQANG